MQEQLIKLPDQLDEKSGVVPQIDLAEVRHSVALEALQNEPDWIEFSTPAWIEHIPFAFWLVEHQRPSRLVELGTHYGNSYFAFCQAIARHGLHTRCFAVDTWTGDEHASPYGAQVFQAVESHNATRYGAFSQLLRSKFDDALASFEDGTIDLLHIDGLHYYESVKHDFESWLPKLSERAVVLFHDTNVHSRDFGVHRLWAELRERYPHFEFLHGNGLGVLGVGPNLDVSIAHFLLISVDSNKTSQLRDIFWRASSTIRHRNLAACKATEVYGLAATVAAREADLQTANSALTAAREELASVHSTLSDAKEAFETARSEVEHFQSLARTERAALVGQIDRFEHAIATERASLVNQIVSANARCQHLEASLISIQRSTTWRLTTPLRVGVHHLKRVSRFQSGSAPLVTLRKYYRGVRQRLPLRQSSTSSTVRNSVLATGLFDENWYLDTYPDLRAAGVNPLEHYLTSGHLDGRSPGPHFSSSEYWRLNPDVPRTTNPLIHYAIHGAADKRKLSASCSVPAPTTLQWPDLFAYKTHTPQSDIAVVVHVYYDSVWPSLASALTRFDNTPDIFVTLVQGQSDHLRGVILTQFPDAHVFTVPNHGRDIYPFMWLLNSGALFDYKHVCKIHTKRSTHREDGDAWRDKLVDAVIGSKERISTILTHLSTDPDIGIVCDAENIFSKEYWGSNETHVNNLAALLNISYSIDELRYPAGSIYWIHPLILRMLSKLELESTAFEPEAGQLDGTLAHAVERIIGIIASDAGLRVVGAQFLAAKQFSAPGPQPGDANTQVIAFYLPQFHPIPENDKWWGRGFTEWNNVARAKPSFFGHDQPRLPTELGYYDLRLSSVQIQQVELAQKYGVDAFCYYYYRFGQKRLLERPLEAMLGNGDIKHKFCVCWANEDWTRSWDGLSKNVLAAQRYDREDLDGFAADLVTYMRDERYVKINNQPVVLIYRLSDIRDYKMVVEGWRAFWKQFGFPDVHVCAVRFHIDILEGLLPLDPKDAGVDAYVEFPPHGVHIEQIGNQQTGLSPSFTGLIYSYPAVVKENLAKHASGKMQNCHRGVMLGWDNSARRGNKAHICQGATPGNFRYWLRETLKQQEALAPGREKLVFINAWNEWAEGTYLEPDSKNGRGYLEAVRSTRVGMPNRNV